MLNLFSASGHFNYAESTRLYVRMTTEDLPETHPWLYDQFSNNKFHSVQRSGHSWTGIWTDLAIEQVLMRSLKSCGGLTRGRRFPESVWRNWVCTMHQCAAIHNSMTALTGLQNSAFISSETAFALHCTIFLSCVLFNFTFHRKHHFHKLPTFRMLKITYLI